MIIYLVLIQLPYRLVGKRCYRAHTLGLNEPKTDNAEASRPMWDSQKATLSMHLDSMVRYLPKQDSSYTTSTSWFFTRAPTSTLEVER